MFKIIKMFPIFVGIIYLVHALHAPKYALPQGICFKMSLLTLVFKHFQRDLVTVYVVKQFLAHRIRISEILPWDRNHILSRTSCNAML